MLVHIKKIVPQAWKRGVAIGAFNVSNLEMVQAVVRAAKAAKSPAIIQTSESAIAYAGLKTIFGIIREVAEGEGKDVPVAVHLDHGKDFDLVKECIAAGYSSVHMDASEFEFSKNVAMTRKAVDYAHKHGVWAQGELGSMFGKEGMSRSDLPKDMSAYLTDPEMVPEFVRKTGVDTLAVSVGTLHGSFAGKEKIRFDLLEQVRRAAKRPLVLHGASGNKLADISRAAGLGVAVVNIDTDLRIAFTRALQKTLAKEITFYDPRKILEPSTLAAQREAMRKMEAFGSAKKTCCQ